MSLAALFAYIGLCLAWMALGGVLTRWKRTEDVGCAWMTVGWLGLVLTPWAMHVLEDQ